MNQLAQTSSAGSTPTSFASGPNYNINTSSLMGTPQQPGYTSRPPMMQSGMGAGYGQTTSMGMQAPGMRMGPGGMGMGPGGMGMAYGGQPAMSSGMGYGRGAGGMYGVGGTGFGQMGYGGANMMSNPGMGMQQQQQRPF